MQTTTFLYTYCWDPKPDSWLPTPPHIGNKKKGKYHVAVMTKKAPFY